MTSIGTNNILILMQTQTKNHCLRNQAEVKLFVPERGQLNCEHFIQEQGAKCQAGNVTLYPIIKMVIRFLTI